MDKVQFEMDMLDLIDMYYSSLEECKTPQDVVDLNWYCASRMISLGKQVFGKDAIPTNIFNEEFYK